MRRRRTRASDASPPQPGVGARVVALIAALGLRPHPARRRTASLARAARDVRAARLADDGAACRRCADAARTPAVAGVQAGARRCASRHQQRSGSSARRSPSGAALQGVLGGMVEGVLVIDANGTVLLVNRARRGAARAAAGTRLRGPAADRADPPSRSARAGALGGDARAAWSATRRSRSRLGGTGPQVLQVTATPDRRRSPTPARAFILVFHDISELKRLERMRRDFVANVSHELRTPLAAIGGYTETLLGGAVDDPSGRAASSASSSATPSGSAAWSTIC